MKATTTLLLLSALLISSSCEKLDVRVPIQVIDNVNSTQSRYFVQKLRDKLDKRKFIVVNRNATFTMEISDFHIHTYYRTETVTDDCAGGHRTYTLEEQELQGLAVLSEDGYVVGSWDIEAANYDVLKGEDPILIQILFPDDENEDCSDYWVKSRERMRANLRACARRIAASATKKVNRLI